MTATVAHEACGKRGGPTAHLSPWLAEEGAAPMIQRVAAAEGSSSGAVRTSKASALPAAVASESRRVATGSMLARADLADHCADGGAAQRFLHGPQHISSDARS